MVLLEVCVDSILSAVNASEAGASRIELCSALSEGGLTPSLGLFEGVKRALDQSKTKIFCMIRIRRSDFVYTDDEIDAMIDDVKYFKTHGADGIVFGCLNIENEISSENCRKIISAWGSHKPVTFHRAFDETKPEDFMRNIDEIISLGFSRVLSSGFKATAKLGIENLKKLVDYSRDKNIIIMPGSGINKDNVAEIISKTGCTEIHASARSEMKTSIVGKISMGGGKEDFQPLLVCDPQKVEDLTRSFKNF